MELTKTCTKCHVEKPLEDFAKDSRGRLGRRSDCKVCNCAKSCEYQKRNPEKVAIRMARWVQDNKGYLSEYRKKNIGHIRQLARIRYSTSQDVREERILSARSYRENPANKERIRQVKSQLQTKYRKNPKWRAVQNLRRRMLFVLAGKRKVDKSLALVGCTSEQLRAYLEQKFLQGMTWENYGIKGWHIDHIKPCDSFDLTKPEEQRACFHYTNLQPLWAKDNLMKGNHLTRRNRAVLVVSAT